MKSIKMPDGSTALVDDATVAYLESRAAQPTQASLTSLLRGVRGARVVDGGCANDKPFGTETLVEIVDPVALEALESSLRVLDGGNGHCMCYGDPTIVVLGGQSQSRTTLEVEGPYIEP